MCDLSFWGRKSVYFLVICKRHFAVFAKCIGPSVKTDKILLGLVKTVSNTTDCLVLCLTVSSFSNKRLNFMHYKWLLEWLWLFIKSSFVKRATPMYTKRHDRPPDIWGNYLQNLQYILSSSDSNSNHGYYSSHLSLNERFLFSWSYRQSLSFLEGHVLLPLQSTIVELDDLCFKFETFKYL